MGPVLTTVIFLAAIGLGLPDSLLGAGWPVIRTELSVPLSAAGIITMIICGGTIVSSLLADRLIRRAGTGIVTAVSIAVTALALFGFCAADSFLLFCLLAIPFGLGAGAVDAALNNHVALYGTSRQMSWYHAFWGVGAVISPNVMGFCLGRGMGFRAGYLTVAAALVLICAAVFLSLPLWKKGTQAQTEVKARLLTIPQALRIPGVPYIMLAFFGFCALESSAGLWASSYLVTHRGISADTAATFASLFYIGETAGRFLNGFVADRFGDRKMIRIGILVMVFGVALLGLPLRSDIPALTGLLIIGVGAAPVYPCIVHATPDNFGKENSQSLVGMQMASAYCGSTFMPPVFGLIAQHLNIGLYPVFLAVFAVLMLVMTEKLNRTVASGR